MAWTRSKKRKKSKLPDTAGVVAGGYRPMQGPRPKPKGRCHWEKINGRCVAVRRTNYGQPKPCKNPEGKNPCIVKVKKVKAKRRLRGEGQYGPFFSGSSSAVPAKSRKGGRTSKAVKCHWEKKGNRCYGAKRTAKGQFRFCTPPKKSKPAGCK